MSRLVTLVLFSSALAACADNGDESILVLKNVAPGVGCTFASVESENLVSHGTLDIGLNKGYQFIGQLKSRIILNTDQTNIDVDAKTIFATAANVDLQFPNSAINLSGLPATLTHFKKLFNASIRPSAITDAPFELIPADLGKAILAMNASPPNVEVEATFTIIGDLNGSEVRSQPFVYPVTLGVGIAANILGTCPLPMGSMPRAGNECNAAQDGIVDCCTDATIGLVCPASVSAGP